MQPVLSMSLLFLANMAAGYLVSNPPGKYNVTLTTGMLVDYTRNDSHTTNSTPRALMLSVFQPSNCVFTVNASYMPNKTAEYQEQYLQKEFNISANLAPLFLEARIPTCPSDSSCSVLDNSSILLFSPGYGTPRLYYSVLASAIASQGFTVISIDHPNDANIITYPDGHAVYYNTSTEPSVDEYTSHVYARVADASFVIDQLINATAMGELLPQRGPRAFSADRIAMLGHSLGGASSVIAASRDARIRGAIDWDGTLFGSLPLTGLSKPVLYMSESNRTDPSWTDAFPKLTGPKLWVQIANTTHETFSDAPTLLQAVGQDTTLGGLLGGIAPPEMVKILATYTAEWMNGVFAGKIGGALLQGQDAGRLPEVLIVQKSGY